MNTEDRFFAVPTRKFVIMYTLTLGWYFIYWFYKNLKFQIRFIKTGKLKEFLPGNRFDAVLGTVFYLFFTYPLFRRVSDKAAESAVSVSWNPLLLAAVFILLEVSSLVTSHLVTLDFRGFHLQYPLSLVILLLSVLPLLFVQNSINSISKDAENTPGNDISSIDYAFLLLGPLLWTFTVIDVWQHTVPA